MFTVALHHQVDPRTVGATRAAASASSEREERLEKEYQALKERNMLMEAQLEAMRCELVVL